MIKPIFWIDACALIECKNRWYQFHLVPKFWALLSEEIELKHIGCPSLIYKELAIGKDHLATWIKSRRAGVCHAEDAAIQSEFGKIADHIQSTYPAHQASDFLSGGDAWLIATAKARGGTVITGENNRRKKKIRIPVVCQHFEVPCSDIAEMLSAIGKPIG